ncbi:MAG: 5-formyltetrahydrofolate cyclo-ligase [Candidatus Aenigmatarchaeota archaeon]
MFKFKNKQEVREFVWKKLKESNECLFPCYGKIPNFKGVEKTILKVLESEEFKKSKRIFISPDTPQRILLNFVNLNEKEVYIATPRLKQGFIKVTINSANLVKVLESGLKIDNLPRIDFALIGSVAVDVKGNRIGKGGGYGDREIKILREGNQKIIIATNVHDLQVFDDLSYLIEKHDEKVNLIFTPTKVIYC